MIRKKAGCDQPHHVTTISYHGIVSTIDTNQFLINNCGSEYTSLDVCNPKLTDTYTHLGLAIEGSQWETKFRRTDISQKAIDKKILLITHISWCQQTNVPLLTICNLKQVELNFYIMLSTLKFGKSQTMHICSGPNNLWTSKSYVSNFVSQPTFFNILLKQHFWINSINHVNTAKSKQAAHECYMGKNSN